MIKTHLFFTPNNLVEWRVRRFSKEPDTIKWIDVL